MEIAVALFASLRQCRAFAVATLLPQLLMEWSELLALGLRSNSSKKTRKEQKQLEETWSIQKVASLLGIICA